MHRSQRPIRPIRPLLWLLAAGVVVVLPASGSAPSISGYAKSSACIGGKIRIQGSGLTPMPARGNVHMGTSATGGQILPASAATRWPEITIPSTLKPGRWWIGLWKGGKELSRGPKTLQLRNCIEAQTPTSTPEQAQKQLPPKLRAKTAPPEAQRAAPGLRTRSAPPRAMASLNAPELEITAVYPRGNPNPMPGDLHELRIQVRNNGNAKGAFGLGYTEGNAVRLGGRHSLEPGAGTSFPLFVELRDQALQRGGTHFETRILLTDPKASTASTRVEDHLYHDANDRNHVRPYDLLLGNVLFDVTIRMLDTFIVHDCDDIDDGLGWEIRLHGLAEGGGSDIKTLKVKGVAGESIPEGPSVVLRNVSKSMDLQANIDVTDFDIVGTDKVGGISIARRAGDWDEHSVRPSEFDLGGGGRDDCGKSMRARLEFSAVPARP